MSNRVFKLQDFAEVVSTSVKPEDASNYERFVGLEHYDAGEPVITRYTDTSLLVSAVKEFKENDILIARRNVYLKRAGIVFFSGVTSGDSIILRIPDTCIDKTGIAKELAVKIIPFVLNSEHFWAYANKHADGMNSKRISKDMLLEYEFELSSNELEEAKSEKLWAAYRLKESYKRLIAATDEMVKSQFIEWFGNPFLSPKNGESVSITDVADIVLGTTPNSKIKEYWDGELKWITPAEIEEESFIISDTVRHITEDGRNSANLTLLPVGSVLFSTRAPIGKVAIAGEEMYCNQGFKNFICKPELNNVFLYYTLRLNKEYLVSLGTGTTFKELSKKIVESIKISVPAKEQQEQFERVFRQSDKSKFELKRAIEAVDKVIKSLING